MKADFREVARPSDDEQPKGGRPRSAAVTAALGTMDTGKAIVLPNEKRARTVRFTCAQVLKRERPEYEARRSGNHVWVEPRVKGRRTR